MGKGNNYNHCLWSSLVTEMFGNFIVSSVMRFWETSIARPQLLQLNTMKLLNQGRCTVIPFSSIATQSKSSAQKEEKPCMKRR